MIIEIIVFDDLLGNAIHLNQMFHCFIHRDF